MLVKKRTVCKAKWITEGDGIDQERLHKLMFVNRAIEDFLFSEGKYFVCAGKGEGKTMLLHRKRTLLEKKYSGACVFIPSDEPYMVGTESFGELKQEVIKYYGELARCKKLWTAAIKISVISYHYESHESSAFFDEILNYLAVDKIEKLLPTDIIEILFFRGVSSLEQFFNKYSNVINRLFRNYVQSGTFVFIDKIDQTLANYKQYDLSKEFWVNMQAGLLEAAWDVKRSNHHVKTYTSIRQESFFNYVSDNKNAMSGEVAFINYDFSELKDMLDGLSWTYENKKSFKEFIGFEDIHNNFSNEDEDAFHYMFRHTVGRPRDLVQICSQLTNRSLTKETYRHVINSSSGVMADSYFEEQSIFLRSIRHDADRNSFFSLIDSNVLTAGEMKGICSRFNGNGCHDDNITREHKHPFCELYNIGLLGVIVWDEVEVKFVQRFLGPNKRNKNSVCSIPESHFYLLHPSLESAIKKSKSHNQSVYSYIPSLPIGHGINWSSENNLKIGWIKLLRNNHSIINADDRLKAHMESFVMNKDVNDKSEFLKELRSSIMKAFTKKIAAESVDSAMSAVDSIVNSA